MTHERARTVLSEHFRGPLTGLDPNAVRTAYRRGAAKLHPDRGGDPEEFRKLKEARNVLLGGGA